MLNIPSLPFISTRDQTGLSIIFFSSNWGIKEIVFNWLRAVEGAKPKYAPEGRRVRIHCFAGLQSAKEIGIDRSIVDRWMTSFGSRQVGIASGDSASTATLLVLDKDDTNGAYHMFCC
jgi:hypothetical protein